MSERVQVVVPGDDPVQIAGSPHLDRLRAHAEQPKNTGSCSGVFGWLPPLIVLRKLPLPFYPPITIRKIGLVLRGRTIPSL